MNLLFVMPGLVPGIHVFSSSQHQSKTWMAGTSPAMTVIGLVHAKWKPLHRRHPGHDRAMRLSAILITKNEAANIGACLDSLAFCDERVGLQDSASCLSEATSASRARQRSV
jgi:hypothetical protein